MEWNAALYDNSHGFVAEYGRSLVELVNRTAGQRILDIGCGTGTLSAELAAQGAEVLGIDSSAEMVARAQAQYADLRFVVEDATALSYEGEFDTAFSNAVFHWIMDQDALLPGIFRALKSGGMLICEFGAKGNVAAVRAAFDDALASAGLPASRRFFLPSPEEYTQRLQAAGFEVLHIGDYDRPTPLSGGEEGLENWMRQFYAADLAAIDSGLAEQVLSMQADNLRPLLFREEQWVLDYRRLRVWAQKP